MQPSTEKQYLDRRAFLKAAALAAVSASLPFWLTACAGGFDREVPTNPSGLLHPEDALHVTPQMQLFDMDLVPYRTVQIEGLSPLLLANSQLVLVELTGMQTRLLGVSDRAGTVLMLKLFDDTLMPVNWIDPASELGTRIVTTLDGVANGTVTLPRIKVQEQPFYTGVFAKAGYTMPASELNCGFFCPQLRQPIGGANGLGLELKIAQLRPSGLVTPENGNMLAQIIDPATGQPLVMPINGGAVPKSIRTNPEIHYVMRMHDVSVTGPELLRDLKSHFDTLAQGDMVVGYGGQELWPIAVLQRSTGNDRILLEIRTKDFQGPVIAMRNYVDDVTPTFHGYALAAENSGVTGTLPGANVWQEAIEGMMQTAAGVQQRGYPITVKVVGIAPSAEAGTAGVRVFGEVPVANLLAGDASTTTDFLINNNLIGASKQVGLQRSPRFLNFMQTFGAANNIISGAVIPYVAMPYAWKRQGYSWEDAFNLGFVQNYPEPWRLMPNSAGAWTYDQIAQVDARMGQAAIVTDAGNLTSTALSTEGECPFVVHPVVQMDGTRSVSVQPLSTDTEICEVPAGTLEDENWSTIFPLGPFDLLPISVDIVPPLDQWKSTIETYINTQATSVPWPLTKIRTRKQYTLETGEQRLLTTEVMLSLITGPDGSYTAMYTYVKRTETGIA